MPAELADGYAAYLDREARLPLRALQGTCSVGNQQVLDELSEVYHECNEEGWDGYGALPVEQDAMHAAYCIIESLPTGFPRPSIGAEPDGQITLEWRKSPNRILSVSVDPSGILHYAGLFGRNKQHGTMEHFFSAPDKLLQLVREL
jgi:hypothetical protein